MGGIIDRISAKISALADWVLETILKLSKALSSFGFSETSSVKLGAEALGPARPGAVTPGAQPKVGLDIGVHVDQDGRVAGVTTRSDNRDVPLSLDNGLSMVAP